MGYQAEVAPFSHHLSQPQSAADHEGLRQPQGLALRLHPDFISLHLA
jgi:hypothetical protein